MTRVVAVAEDVLTAIRCVYCAPLHESKVLDADPEPPLVCEAYVREVPSP